MSASIQQDFAEKIYHTLQYLHTLMTSNILWSLFPKEAREANNSTKIVLNVR